LVVGGLMILHFVQKERQKRVLMRATMPRFKDRPNLTIESAPHPSHLVFTLMRLKGILADPEIPRVPWEQITMGERIGKGASGLVTSGTWDA
jgi:hypothetical protein